MVFVDAARRFDWLVVVAFPHRIVGTLSDSEIAWKPISRRRLKLLRYWADKGRCF